ncbi:peptidoglycan DD-metalloendopeptidase family protein [Tsukamurella ocularis]|uniref:peptidoglycan DD-metalloendopeptidase family protein n=1 Tax=Tsukamurella ocularis TaxID=1970234 RepID=UPI0021686FFD|nr:peptidoglycan DD-metalloendopeptidase family protein [Tsukamurella ocularis]MCS3779398.1 cell wall-associated NlpC family hydrolase [Tsukamurella ocularis]MCS3789872.1 cell wall-associated NlpC family hydrolase [Tsukamurella ocularis]
MSGTEQKPTKVITALIAVMVVGILLLAGVVIFGSGKPATTADPCNPTAGSDVLVNVPPGSTVKPMRAGTYELTSGFGPRWGTMHQGQDLAGPGEPDLIAFADSTVREAGDASGFGKWIILDFKLGGKKYSAVYGHMWPAGVLVKTGDQVKAGQVIGKQGGNGQVTGPHLHFEIWEGGRLDGGKAVDPAPFLASAKDVGAAGGAPADPSVDPTAPRGPPPGVDLVAATQPIGVTCSTLGGAGLNEARVPKEFVPWIKKAAQTCPDITAPLIAAQLENESTFNRLAESRDNGPGIGTAKGAAQFIDSTWAAESVDGDGDGIRDVWNIADAVMSQGKLDCKLIDKYKKAVAEKRAVGDPIELMLSAYNCGEANTDAGGRVCQNSQTLPYVKNIPNRARTWFSAPQAQAGAAGGQLAGEFGARVAQAVRTQLGVRYAWAGGDANGPTIGRAPDAGVLGFDCSGLTLYAVAQAAKSMGKTLVLPHSTTDQVVDPRGVPVALDQVAPGDLVFQKGLGHVAVFVGNGKVIDAPQSGAFVQEIDYKPYNYESARRFS